MVLRNAVNLAQRIAKIILGFVVLLAGLLMLVTPGPGGWRFLWASHCSLPNFSGRSASSTVSKKRACNSSIRCAGWLVD